MGELTVNWAFAEPAVAARSWHQWQNPPKNRTDDAALERDLGWPAGTLAALHDAFAARLGRFTGWEGSPLPPARQAAARVFKRGVPWRDHGQDPAPVRHQGSYPIHVAAAATAPRDALATLIPSGYAVVDAAVESAWSLAGRFPASFVVGLNEKTKTLPSVARLCREARARNPRGAPWVIVGGGLLADTAAFAASLLGHPFILVPTTLLAMADACVGGKTGVNFPPHGKNQVGAFRFPLAVHAVPAFLATLPRRHWLGGGAECLKHAFLVGDRTLASALAKALADGDGRAMAPMLPRVIQVKADVVAQDPAEEGLRASLNLGHTLAHALEGVAHAHLPEDAIIQHGEAVAYGLLFAAHLSHEVTRLPAADLAFIRDTIMATGVIRDWPSLCAMTLGAQASPDALWERLQAYIAVDKKNVAAGVGQWVLLEALGRVHPGPAGTYVTPVPAGALAAAWRTFTEQLGAPAT